MAFEGISLEISASKVTAAVSTFVISVAGVFFGIQHGYTAELDALRMECDVAQDRAVDSVSLDEQYVNAYIVRLERDSETLQTSNIDLNEHSTRLRAVNHTLREQLRSRGDSTRAVTAALNFGGERQAGPLSTSERDPGDLEATYNATLRTLHERTLAFEGARLSMAREHRNLSDELAYEQWLKIVRQTVEGECRNTWGRRRFSKCAEQVEQTLSPLEGSALECLTRGHGLPFYTVNPPARINEQDFLELNRGVVVPCDPTLRDIQ